MATWIYQDGIGAGLLGFESQGYLDAWAPAFFFAMLFALGMDYAVFLTGDPPRSAGMRPTMRAKRRSIDAPQILR